MKVKEETEKAGLKLNTQKNEDQGIWFHYLWQIDGKQWKQRQILFSWAPKSLQTETAVSYEIKALAPWKKSYDQPSERK